jgi:hypothetical protein
MALHLQTVDVRQAKIENDGIWHQHDRMEHTCRAGGRLR